MIVETEILAQFIKAHCHLEYTIGFTIKYVIFRIERTFRSQDRKQHNNANYTSNSTYEQSAGTAVRAEADPWLAVNTF